MSLETEDSRLLEEKEGRERMDVPFSLSSRRKRFNSGSLRTSDSVFFFFFLLFYSPQETAGSLKSAECIAKVPLRHPVKYSRLDCSSISPSSFPPCPLEPVEHLAVHKIASKPLESAGIDAKTWPRVSRSCPMMGFHAILSFILRDRATLNSREMKRSTYRFSIIERN